MFRRRSSLSAALVVLLPLALLAQQSDITTKPEGIASRIAEPDDRPVPAVPLPADTNATLRVQLGRTLMLKSPEPIKRISVTDAAVATAISVSPNELIVNGLSAGTVTLIIWDDQDRSRAFDLQVGLDVVGAQDTLQRMFPGEAIEVSSSGKSLVLRGNVSSKLIAEQAVALAQTQSPTVVNLLLQTPPSSETIMLQVRFAEVNRSAVQELGLNIFSTGGANTIGSVGTQQFGQMSTNSGAVPAGVNRGKDPAEPSLAAGGIGNPLSGMPSVFGLSDLLNVFLFRPDLNLGATVRALQQRNLLQMLAEPNILARNGTEANFLAGGEFPFPILQGGAIQTVTIVFKEFGVRLKFLPTIQPNGLIRLKVQPEVSSLDFANALTISGFIIPALSTRRVDTEVELRDGQSFAIAGLVDNRTREVGSRVPGLSSIPIIGNLFKSKADRKDNTELLVIVTPKLVRPSESTEVPSLPLPKPFLDKEQFDRKTGAVTPAERREGANAPR